MRYPKEHKEQTRRRIVEAAARLFRRHGYKATGVDAVMAEAGLTAGGFYGHFRSKEELFGEVLRHAFESSPLRSPDSLCAADGQAESDVVATIAGVYLSEEHRAHPEEGCPLPSLAPEVARSSSGIRRRFEGAVLGWRDEIARYIDGEGLSEEARKEVALGVISTLVGGMALARACRSEAAREQLLRSACAQAVAATRSRIEERQGRARGELPKDAEAPESQTNEVARDV